MGLRTRTAVLIGRLLMMVVVFGAGTETLQAQGYGGFYGDDLERPGGSSGGDPSPEPTPEPDEVGTLSLTIRHNMTGSAPDRFPVVVQPGSAVSLTMNLTVHGKNPGNFRLAAMVLDSRLGTISPSRGGLSGSGNWTATVKTGSTPGSLPVLFVVQDSLGNYRSASRMCTVAITTDEPSLLIGGLALAEVVGSPELRKKHRSLWSEITLRNWVSPSWFAHLCDDLYRDRAFLEAVSKAVRIDRDRLNITHEMPAKESFRSYATLEPIMSKYWVETGITVSALTANEIGNVFVYWRTNQGLSVTMSEDIVKTLGLPGRSVKVGNVMNGVGAAMIILDFWSNMANAESPAESREAWFKAGYGSLDLYLSNLVANTFGAAAALPGMFTSYILMTSYDTLIGGYKSCWFKKMVEQALDADLLGRDMHDTLAVNRVLDAMRSSNGLKKTLSAWWMQEAPTWAGKMGGCGNWDLAEARGYREAFVDRLMRTAEVEINGEKIHPWSFYYSVSRKLAMERNRELSREIAGHLRDLEGAYLATLQQKRYRGAFKVVTGVNGDVPIPGAVIRPVEWERHAGWKTNPDGFAFVEVDGRHFSPEGTILMVMHTARGGTSLHIAWRHDFVEVSP